MYLYYFNVDHGRSNEILVARVIETKTTRNQDYPLALRLDGNSELVQYWIKNHTKKYREQYTRDGKWISFSNQEGMVYKRRFWLDGELDMNRAKQIIANYTATKMAELHARLKRMEELA